MPYVITQHLDSALIGVSAGKIAYEAYYRQLAGVAEVPLDKWPTWESASPVVKELWEGAAAAVLAAGQMHGKMSWIDNA